ncbi:hypothetical protein [Flagellimonas sp. S3867]|uniref:hypothetical protein n=1 Tax=Flagellimonas sp. S3867 TaxID=2768063 RepID=UPI0016895D7F|nr:hypothetical protein [Flagellimonas sp. S3867]
MSIQKRKVLFTAILSGLFVVLIKTYLPLKRSNSEIANDFWIKKTHQKEKKNIVVGGNSRIYRGISIKAIQSGLDNKLSGVNLGYSALGYSNEYLDFLLSRVDLKSKNKVVVLALDVGPLTDIAVENKSFARYKSVSNSEIFKVLYLNEYVNISSYKPSEIIRIFQKTAENRHNFVEDRKNYFAKYYEDGWVASYKVPNNPMEALPVYKKFAEDNNMQISNEVYQNLLFRIQEFVEMGIEVICFRPPSTLEMQEWENEKFKFDENKIRKEIEEMGGHWIEINTTEYKSYDGSHLHYLSAEKLSKIIGIKMNQILYK